MAEFPLTYEQVKCFKDKINGLESDLELIEKTLGILKAWTNHSTFTWEETYKELNPLITSIWKASYLYKPLESDFEDSDRLNDKKVDNNNKSNYELSELEAAAEGLWKIRNYPINILDNAIKELDALKNMIKPLKNWESYNSLEKLFENVEKEFDEDN